MVLLLLSLDFIRLVETALMFVLLSLLFFLLFVLVDKLDFLFLLLLC